MFDLISVGDATLDNLFKIHDAHLAFGVDKEKKELCINYGNKIPVEQYVSSVAGNCANNATAGARLGLKTAAYINIGSDWAGKKIFEKLKAEKVDTRYLTINGGMDSNASAVVSFQGERTILVYHQPWKYSLPDLDKTKWIYFSSVAPSFAKSNLTSQLENYLERTGASLGFNPGTYQLQYGVKKFPRLLSLTKVLFVNLEEAELILELEKASVKTLLSKLHDLGPKMVVITAGREGSYSFDGEQFFKLDVFPAELVEMTGAGDAYASGCLAGLFFGENLAEAMRWGAANGAAVVGQVGSTAGLLTYDRMQEQLKKCSGTIAEKI